MPVSAARRRFLKRATAAGLAFANLAGLSHARPRTWPIVVIGAGLAGLAAAVALRRAGERVVVLEARDAPGGRIRTWRDGFLDHQCAEAGPTRIADVHRRCLALATALGLPLEPYPPSSAHTLLVHAGCRFGATEVCDRADPSLALAAGERGRTVAELLAHYVGSLPALLRGTDISAAAPFRAELDALSWPAWLASRGASPAAIELMTLGAASRDLAALYVMRQQALHHAARRYFRIGGGMDRLPKALAARLGDSVGYGIAVSRIEHDPSGVCVHADRDGRAIAIDARAVVVALPPAALRTITFDPGLGSAKSRAIAGVEAYPAHRYALQTRTRCWQDAGLDGTARTDAPAEIAPASCGQPGDRGLLHVTAGAASAAALDWGIAAATQAFPQVEACVERAEFVDWAREPGIGGAFATFRPGQSIEAPAALARAEGRLHFAGEHTSPWTGWMEGALDSAARVRRELAG